MIEIRCVINGYVQGVAYRTYVQDAATALGVIGYVQNMRDGTVYVVAQGERDTLKDFVEYLNEGSLRAKVAGVAVEWGTRATNYEDFGIVHT